MAIDFEGKAVVRRQAAPMPERPAPTMRTSRCSAMMVLPDRCGPAGAGPVPAVYEQGVDEVNTLLRGCYADRMTSPSAAKTTPATGPAPDAATDAAAGSVPETGPRRGRRAAKPSGDERQHAILVAAERLLGEKDFADVTIDDLARGAGISRPTFYFYFASKQAVLLTLLDQVAHEAEKRTADVFSELPTAPATAWRKAIEAFAGTFAAHRGVSVAAAAARSSEPELAAEWATLTNRWIDATAAAIRAERDRGASPDGPEPRRLASALNLLNERVITAALTGLDPAGTPRAAAALADVEDTVETLLHIWLTSIYGAVPADS
jgi:AcrR family transcriptional regulator